MIMDACVPSIDKAVEVLIDHGVDFVSGPELYKKITDRFEDTELVKGLVEYQKTADIYLQAVEEEKRKEDGLSSLGHLILGNPKEKAVKKFLVSRLESSNYAKIGGNLANTIIFEQRERGDDPGTDADLRKGGRSQGTGTEQGHGSPVPSKKP